MIDLSADRLLASARSQPLASAMLFAALFRVVPCCNCFALVRVVRAFLIEEQKIVKKVLLEKQKKKKA